ncbi:MAG: hypothetical protein M1820_006019 [Bogoriella megaspora]|nr:MAG: hypothetical protein M1820_006019 [Bogoriella megaspora]
MASGGILNGLDIGIISPVSAMSSFRNSIASTSSTIHGLVVSSILLPAALTSLFAGRLADALGRPRAVFIGSFVFGLGAALEAGAVHLAMFLVGRVISGAGEGLFLSVTVVYISELSPPDMRGFLTGMVQFVTTVGILLGYFIAYATVHYESSASWRAPLAVLAGCAILFAAASLTLPQSPRWMLLHGQHEEARKLCERLGVPKLEQVLSNQSAILSHEKQAAETQKVEEIENPVISRSLMRAFRKDVRGRTALGIFTQAMSQLSGIDSVLYYAPQIFQQTGLVNDTQSFLTSGVQAIVIVAVTVPGLILADRWKRRTSTILGGSLLAGLSTNIPEYLAG